MALVGSKPHGGPLVFDASLGVHEVYDRIGRILVELGTVGSPHSTDIPGKLHHRALKAEAKAEEGGARLPGIFYSVHLPINAPMAKAPGD